MRLIQTIVSGGQTGADRAALDFALQHGFTIQGYCPQGRRANDGVITDQYPLQEATSTAYPPRTRKNVLLADATIIFNGLPQLSSGSHTTIKYARMHKKKFKLLRAFPNTDQDANALKEWLAQHKPASLNIAGNSEETCSGMYQYVFSVLTKVLL